MSPRRPSRRKRDGTLLISFFLLSLASRRCLPPGPTAMVHAAQPSPPFPPSSAAASKDHRRLRNEMTEDPITVGGGAVNEKQRRFLSSTPSVVASPPDTGLNEVPEAGRTDGRSSSSSSYRPSLHRSHLLHAIEGLDRYPNYLSRWSTEDAERLERALEERLDQVRTQKEQARSQRQEMGQVLQSFLAAHPHWADFVSAPQTWDEVRTRVLDGRASSAIFQSSSFSRGNGAEPPTVDDVLSGRVAVGLDAALLQEWMDEEMFDVYSFPLLAEPFCRRFHQFVTAVTEALEVASRSASSPSSSVGQATPLNRGIHKDLDSLGLSWLNDLLFHLIVRPLSGHLYGETELAGGGLDWRQGFIAAYSASPTQSRPRQRLVPHTDDAEVTLNVCLGDKFDGGDLRFWGLRGGTTAGRLLGEYEPEIGRAIIHSGRHLHEVTEVTTGNRFAYIQWARSWESTRKGTCPCCWLNRRENRPQTNNQQPCICGSRWN